MAKEQLPLTIGVYTQRGTLESSENLNVTLSPRFIIFVVDAIHLKTRVFAKTTCRKKYNPFPIEIDRTCHKD